MPLGATPQDPAVAATRSGRTLPLRLHLLGLVLIVLLPALAAGGFAAWDAITSHRRAFENGISATAQALALAMDSEIRAIEAMLRALAAANELEPGGDLEGFHARRGVTAREAGLAFVLVGPPPDYQRLFDTRRPFGAPLAAGLQPRETRPPLERVARTRQPEVFGIRRDPYGAWAAGVMVPVLRDGAVIGILVGLFDPARLTGALSQPGLTARGVAVLVDAEGRTVARSRDHDQFIGVAIPEDGMRDHLRGGGPRILLTTSQEGDPIVVASAPLRIAPGWRLAVLEPIATYDAAWRRPVAILGLGGAAALLAAALAAFLLSRRLARPVQALAAHAEATGRGDIGPPRTAGAAARPGAAGLVPGFLADAQGASEPADGDPAGIARISDAGVREYAMLRDALLQSAGLLAQRGEAAHAAAIEARAGRRLLETVIEALPDAVFVKDEAGRYLLVNRAALGLLGVTRDVARGRDHGFALPPEERDVMVARHDRVRATGVAERSENRRLLPDGTHRHYETLTVRWSLPDGVTPGGTIGVSRDVTEQRRMEAELLAAEAMLTNLVRRATVSALTTGLSHELNQPLAAAGNYIAAVRQLLGSGHGAMAPEQREAMAGQALEGAAAQVRRAGDIIRRLRDFMKGQPLATQPEDPATVAREAVRLVNAALPEARAIAVRFDLPDGLPPVAMDRVQVQQVLLNLLRNAMEALATPPEGAAAEWQPEVRLSARITAPDAQGTTWLAFSVTDNGPGLPDAVAAGGFEPLRTSKPEGMGLGLAICRDIARAHGGTLRAEPAPGGHGARMVLALPLARAAVALAVAG